MKASTPLLIVVSVLIGAVLGYTLGYKTEPQRERLRSDAKLRIRFGQRWHRFLEAGDTNRALSEIRFVLWNDTVEYQRRFGIPSGNDSFARHFAEAKAMTAQVEPALKENGQRFEQEIKSLLASNNITPNK